MENIVGIICEYNPFHKGHLYQVETIKKEIPNSKIVAIMSGNTTQRGEFTLLSKHKRAELAIESGVDLVLELPFPYCSSTAEIFASAGVEIAKEIGCTHLCFGTENCDLDYISSVANIIDTPAFDEALRKELNNRNVSYIIAREKALGTLGLKSELFANDMLGVEYVRAINKTGANIKPIAIKRTGAGYNDTDVCDVMSASAIRKNYYNSLNITGVPDLLKGKYDDFLKEGELLEETTAKDFLYRSVLILPQKAFESAFDSSIEIASIIKTISTEALSGEDFFNKLSTKTYTRARLIRVILYAIFGVEQIDMMPKFAPLLATNEHGREIISRAKKSNLKIITKHSDSKELDALPKSILERLYLVDKIYISLLENGKSAGDAYKQKPLIK